MIIVTVMSYPGHTQHEHQEAARGVATDFSARAADSLKQKGYSGLGWHSKLVPCMLALVTLLIATACYSMLVNYLASSRQARSHRLGLKADDNMQEHKVVEVDKNA